MPDPTSHLSPTAELYAAHVMPTYPRFDLQLARGEGPWVWDEAGRKYLDFGAGIAVCALGHAHPRILEALARQGSTLIHTSNLYQTRPAALLARRLCGFVGAPGKVFFCNSGAEANEGLYKLARKFGNTTAPGGRFEVLTFENSFHGRTLAGIAATGQEKVKKGFEPMVEGFRQVPLNDLAAVEAAIGPRTAAILLEPIQGESGIRPANPDFLRGLRRLCDARGLLLMFDEVQCGLGRTGNMCGWKTVLGTDEVLPDAVSWAKGIAAGFPFGAFWAGARPVPMPDGTSLPLSDLLGPGTHATTYGGNPLGAAVSSAVFDVIEEQDLTGNALRMGARLVAGLQALHSPWIVEVRAYGLLLGFELAGDFPVSAPSELPSLAMVRRLHLLGLLSVPAGARVVRLLPPLDIGPAEIDAAVQRVGEALG